MEYLPQYKLNWATLTQLSSDKRGNYLESCQETSNILFTLKEMLLVSEGKTRY